MNGDDANAFAVNVPRDARVAKPPLRRSPGQEVAYELNVSDFTAHLSFAATSDFVTDVSFREPTRLRWRRRTTS